MVLDDPFATDVEQLHQTTSLGANIDPAYDEVRQSLAGKPLVDFAFGCVSLKDLRPDEVVELFVIQYLVTATKR